MVVVVRAFDRPRQGLRDKHVHHGERPCHPTLRGVNLAFS
jgi:hypothetical protein